MIHFARIAALNDKKYFGVYMKRYDLNATASFLAMITALGVLAHTSATAQDLSVDPTAAQSIVIDTTQSGVPIVHIDAPNQSGVSHNLFTQFNVCLLYTSPSPRDKRQSRMPSSA